MKRATLPANRKWAVTRAMSSSQGPRAAGDLARALDLSPQLHFFLEKMMGGVEARRPEAAFGRLAEALRNLAQGGRDRKSVV